MPDKTIWGGGDEYERFMGRWSRLVSREFLTWLNMPQGARWLDIGCGTGVLTEAILSETSPQSVIGIDPSAGQLALAQARITSERADFMVGDLATLADTFDMFDAVVSGLVLNFIPEVETAVALMKSITRPDGCVAAYVWDYADRMEFLRYFWDAAVRLDAKAAAVDESARSPICNADGLQSLFLQAGLEAVKVEQIEIVTLFADFADFWLPFLGGRGTAGAYVISLTEQQQNALQATLHDALPISDNGEIQLVARAWAVRGTKGET